MNYIQESDRVVYTPNIYRKHVRRAFLEDWQGDILVERRKINNLRYADDTLIIAVSEAVMAEIMDKLKAASER